MKKVYAIQVIADFEKHHRTEEVAQKKADTIKAKLEALYGKDGVNIETHIWEITV